MERESARVGRVGADLGVKACENMPDSRLARFYPLMQ